MTTFNLPCPFPADPVHVFLFTEVLNAIELKTRLLSGDAEYLYAFLDAEFIVSQLHLLAAVNRALHDTHYGLMRTKHLHSEIVYALAATQNIAEALRTFGLNDSTKSIVVVKLSSAHSSEVAAHVRKIVKGKEQPFEDKNLQPLTDLKKVCKVYKLGVQNSRKQKDDSENNSRWKDPIEYTKVIIGSIALRGSS